jgi:hypothetical protein
VDEKVQLVSIIEGSGKLLVVIALYMSEPDGLTAKVRLYVSNATDLVGIMV